jgi:hypothetical protein
MNAIRYAPAEDAKPQLPATFSIANARLPQAYENAKIALADCASIDECQTWADQAEALAAYAKMAEDDVLRKTCDRIQARAIRRMGELLKQIDPARGANQNIVGDTPHKVLTRKQAAKDAGLSTDQMKQAIRVATVPAASFEAQVDSDTPPTVTALAEQGTAKRPSPPVVEAVPVPKTRPVGFAAATSLIGTVEDFASFCKSQNPEIVAAAVMSHEVTDVRDHVATIDAWLDRFVVNLKG